MNEFVEFLGGAAIWAVIIYFIVKHRKKKKAEKLAKQQERERLQAIKDAKSNEFIGKIHKGELAAIDSDVNLQKGESCYFECDARWEEGAMDEMGDLYMTNKRIIFIADNNKPKTLLYSRVLQCVTENGKAYIQKDSGDSPYISLTSYNPNVFVELFRYLTAL